MFHRAEPIGQVAQELGEPARFLLRLRHADGVELENRARRRLSEPPQISRDYGCDLGVSAGRAAVRHQHDRRAVPGYLNATVHRPVRDDVVTVEVLNFWAFKPVPHAIAGRRYFPFAVEKQPDCRLAKLVVLRPQYEPDRSLFQRGKVDATLDSAARIGSLQFVSDLQWTRIGAAKSGARIHGQAAKHGLARDPAFDREIAERAPAGKIQGQGLTLSQRHRAIRCDGATGNLGFAPRTCQTDAHGSLSGLEMRCERAYFDRCRKRLICDECVGGGERKPVHRTARGQTIALGTVTAAVLNRTCGPDLGNDELTHAAINSATTSPRSAARSCSSKVRASTGENVTSSPGSSKKVGSRWS